MSLKSSRLFLMIIVNIAILFASAGLQAQQANRQFQGGGPIVAQIGGTGPFYGNETGSNTWFGEKAGASITTGTGNSFFGKNAGLNNKEGSGNSFFGLDAGHFNPYGNFNSFFGKEAGYSGTVGGNDSFFGNKAGYSNQNGGSNSFFGDSAGYENTSGSWNSIFGGVAGRSNTSESNNTFVGAWSDGAAGVTEATALGYRAKVTQSNSLVLGSVNGANGAWEDTNVGIGTTAPMASLHVQSGDIYVGSANHGVILKSPDGTKCAKLSIDNSGALVTAVQACPGEVPPGKATLIYPTGTIQGNAPTYQWRAVSGATWYWLWVNDSATSGGKITTWYTAAQAGCASGSGTCSVAPSIPLAKGNAQWWIQTWNEFGNGPWSDGMTFVVP
jgi:hypothetical protein